MDVNREANHTTTVSKAAEKIDGLVACKARLRNERLLSRQACVLYE